MLLAIILPLFSCSHLADYPGFADPDDFSQAVAVIRDNYVDSLREQDLACDSIPQLLSNIDAYGAYLKAEPSRALDEGPEGGVGLHIAQRNGEFHVVAATQGGPAERAGLLSGDVLLAIDNTTTAGLNLPAVIQGLRGPSGSLVTIAYRRERPIGSWTVRLKRENLPPPEITASMFAPSVLYVRVPQFTYGTASLFSRALRGQRDLAQLKGLIIDLRNNPGGLLPEAVALADLLIAGGG